jgi:FkbM family methyltransferase
MESGAEFRALRFNLGSDDPNAWMSGIVRNALRRVKAQGVFGAVGAYWRMFRWARARQNPERRFLETRILGSRMRLDLRNPGISEDLNKYGFREGEQLHLLRKTLKPGMCVLDIGGNIGYYTCLIARTVGQEGQVYAVEPDPENCALLRSNVELNGYDAFTEVGELGISDRCGERTFHLAGVSNRHSFHDLSADPGDEHSGGGGGSITVKVMDLPTYLADRRRPDYLRMDVEGHEVEVLRGLAAEAARSDWRPAVMFEAHPWHYEEGERDIREPLRDLFDLGYKTKWLVSTREPAEAFRARGLEPVETVRPVETEHGFYEDVPAEAALDLIAAEQRTKAVFLQRQGES